MVNLKGMAVLLLQILLLLHRQCVALPDHGDDGRQVVQPAKQLQVILAHGAVGLEEEDDQVDEWVVLSKLRGDAVIGVESLQVLGMPALHFVDNQVVCILHRDGRVAVARCVDLAKVDQLARALLQWHIGYLHLDHLPCWHHLSPLELVLLHRQQDALQLGHLLLLHQCFGKRIVRLLLEQRLHLPLQPVDPLLERIVLRLNDRHRLLQLTNTSLMLGQLFLHDCLLAVQLDGLGGVLVVRRLLQLCFEGIQLVLNLLVALSLLGDLTTMRLLPIRVEVTEHVADERRLARARGACHQKVEHSLPLERLRIGLFVEERDF
mmetsp:Transcript_14340/g.32235  ORF Transcript_14340/g.32235 Transcript_14340/m.32235 type:complete len:320 (+) Transcript_14340:789-1748(+)